MTKPLDQERISKILGSTMHTVRGVGRRFGGFGSFVNAIAAKELTNAAEDKAMDQQASSGIAWSDVAASAYRAYAANTGNVNFRGEQMPEFKDLPRAIQIAWEAAVRHAVDCVSHQNQPDSNKWAGWLPPQ